MVTQRRSRKDQRCFEMRDFEEDYRVEISGSHAREIESMRWSGQENMSEQKKGKKMMINLLTTKKKMMMVMKDVRREEEREDRHR